jgi:GNAT superfamily N-acetyltransferase
MSIYIKPIPASNDSLRQYVKFGIDLYKDNPYYVPPLIYDEIATLSPEKNPAYDFCEAQCFMALRNGEPVGRITALINKKANEKFNEHVMRFGWLDFIDDQEVVDALFAAAEQWGRERGMNRMVGPMGFTDMDHEGMLTFGFDEAGTMATIYNYEYYPQHMERLGFEKEVDWVEYRLTVPDAIPDKYQRIANIVAQKYELRNLKFTSRSKLKNQYGHALFELVNEAYSGLYGYTELTDKQIDGYIEQYIGVLRLEDVSIVVDKDDKLIAVGIAMPSLSDALRKGKGKLFPTGWWHLLQAIKGKTDVVDLLLVAVKPEYQSKGVNALLFSDLIPAFISNGYKYAESNLELEENENVQKQWEYFERRLHRRRRAWQKAIK